jgi:protein-S-isoprenylcysteine O-methyltransferase Ste14
MTVLVWAARVLRHYMDVNGVTEDHELVAWGPYGYVRHPVYGSFTAIAAGLGPRVPQLSAGGGGGGVAGGRQVVGGGGGDGARVPEGLGDAYRTYSERTGRFLPTLKQLRR